MEEYSKNYRGILGCNQEPINGHYECKFCDDAIPEEKVFISIAGDPYCGPECLKGLINWEKLVENPD